MKFIKNKKSTCKSGPPMAQDLRQALTGWIRYIQSLLFRDEVERCKRDDELQCRSKLRHLKPFIDKDGILRVGGRISRAELPFEAKHPIILPKNNHLTKLLIEQAHQYTLHGGPTLMSTFLANYWIFGKADQIKRTFNSCVKCLTYRSKPEQQI